MEQIKITEVKNGYIIEQGSEIWVAYEAKQVIEIIDSLMPKG